MNIAKRLNILAASDIHGKLSVYKWIAQRAGKRDVDLVILAGDLTASRFFPREDEIKKILMSIRKPVLFIMGNMDENEWMREANLVNINEKKYIFNEIPFIGYQYTNPFVCGNFEKNEHEQGEDLDRLAPLMESGAVLVTHGPCFGILDETRKGHHVGGRSLRHFCEENRPEYHLFGHIHESAGAAGNHFNISFPRDKSVLKLEYFSGEYEFIRVG